ncbi:MAG TPA: hypothetical protein VK102_00935 [Sphingobacterium sp.]|nr:hypothetical protein [Sphingobacterium sp.]
MEIRNNFWVGCALGLLFPAVGFIIIYAPTLQLFSEQKQMAFFFLVIAINLGIMRYTYKKKKDKFSRGVLLSTGLAFFYFVFINKHLLSF